MTNSTSPTSNPDAGGKPSPILIVFLIFPILGLLAAAALALSSSAGSVPATPEPITLQQTSLIDKPAPNFELSDLDRDRLRLSNYRGRTVFVNFWATWCEPCIRELPAFEEFQAEQGEDGAIVLAVNADEPPETISAYFAENDISGLTVLLDVDLEVLNAYAVDRFPTTYVIDAGGTVRYKHYGEIRQEDMAAYLDKLISH
jgi:thiol-disulfide isomerase/thioredoxin